MNSRTLCFQLLIFILAPTVVAEEAPNVLFIAIDDLRPELGCYGVDEIQSPHIDAFAARSVTFKRAYCQLAVCNPSRVSMLTGMRPDTCRVWDLATRFRTTVPEVTTLPQHFKKHGYHAVSFGKIFHNPWPDNDSWSEPHEWPESSLWSEEAKDELQARKDEMTAEGKPWRAIDRIRPLATEEVDVADEEHIDGAIAEQALAAIRRLAEKDQPFFLAAGFIRPHLPFVVPKRYWDLYDPATIPVATNSFLPRRAPGFSMNTMYELRDYMDFLESPTPRQGSLTEAQQRRLKHGYYASVSYIDTLVGKLITELDELDLTNNTIVVVWSDHGWKLGEHNSWCKQTNYEIDTRVPLIIHVPNAEANGESTDALVELLDVYPTLCDLADLPLPDHLEGESMRPLLNDPEQNGKLAAFSQFQRRVNGHSLMGYAMRTDRYRYVEWQDRKTRKPFARELYDHANDPQENDNIAGEVDRALLEELREQLWAALPPPPEFVERDTRPNIVFCMADDWSWPHASILGDPAVKTPHFDRIANEGVLFESAFVSTPSCTPSRLSVLTGQHHWRLREGDSLGGSLREEYPVYTNMLAEAGYHVGRFGKGVWPSKHEFRGRDSFGERYDSFEAFLKDRQDDQPFCFWHGGQDPHRPYELGVGERNGVDPTKVRVPACLPDNDIVRGDLADYLWEVQRFDSEVGGILSRLEEIGELENTIIVVSGDNGMPFPRCKATLYDLGTRVPLAVRWGARIQSGRRVADFVNLCDLAPTLLTAARLKAPTAMTGHSLLPQWEAKASGQINRSKTFVLMGMERHVYPYPARAIRTKDFLYIRNFSPEHWPTGEAEGNNPRYDFSQQPWPTEPGAFSFNIDPSPTKQFLRLNRDDESIKHIAEFSFGRRPKEELYDLRVDPDQLQNVAEQEDYTTMRRELSQMLESQLEKANDPRFARQPNH